MQITAQLVKELRERTGAGMMDCKKALTETEGDMDKAVEYLQVKGMAAAAKKAARVAAEGLVNTWISDDQKQGVIVELNCETDFVSRNEGFQELVAKFTTTIGNSTASNVEEALALPFEGTTLADELKEAISTIGENIQLRRFARLSEPDGFVASYIHAGSQIGVLLAVKSADGTDKHAGFARDVAMHIAAMSPTVLSQDQIDAGLSAAQQDIFTQIVIEEGKPANIAPKIVEGKMAKWRREISLLDQAYVKNPDLTIDQYQKEVGGVTLTGFSRLQVGEGIEKETKSLADEVAAQLKG